mmetsp:Transcript_87299/g.245042  ORF Transcript_87299/g.245042 Transcript_87299/m.245042 type:complete len:205 (+) Transcript_87299:1719-2333(+)
MVMTRRALPADCEQIASHLPVKRMASDAAAASASRGAAPKAQTSKQNPLDGCNSAAIALASSTKAQSACMASAKELSHALPPKPLGRASVNRGRSFASVGPGALKSATEIHASRSPMANTSSARKPSLTDAAAITGGVAVWLPLATSLEESAASSAPHPRGTTTRRACAQPKTRRSPLRRAFGCGPTATPLTRTRFLPGASFET